ncbi:MAG: adenosine deaminase [Elusimicrobia bacterium GWA2_69_24]|nr:MAG: adenosine deaminase [Elusimicrobia bacterium GWA2_69_24]HBL16104.1 adenosine deaminase family protein [Elusimicrobiota bacterium]
MQKHITAAFLKKVPKTDLHLHLDGSLRLSTLIELARQEGVKLPSYDEAGMRELVFKDRYANLPEYLKGFGFTCAVMQTPENIERVARELVEDNIAEGVRYIEVRFGPQLHTAKGMTPADAIRAVIRGLEAGAKAHNGTEVVRSGKDLPFHSGVIVCAMRRFSKGMSPYFADILRVMAHADKRQVYAATSLELARTAGALIEHEKLPIVGFDLAGEESGFPPNDHWEAYQYAHSRFIKKTVHAGEAYGPESIFQAITECHANRIGHGTFLFHSNMIKDPKIKDHERYVQDLVDYIASQRIGIEVCVTSNLQTVPYIASVQDHPVAKMIEAGLSVTLCTDNRLVSNTTVTHEFELVAKHIKLSRRGLRNLVVAGFKGSFFPGSYNDKRAFVRAVIQRYEELEKEFLPPAK